MLQRVSVLLLCVWLAVISADHHHRRAQIQSRLQEAEELVQEAEDRTDQRAAAKSEPSNPSELFQNLRRPKSPKARKISKAAEILEEIIRRLKKDGIDLSDDEMEEVAQLAGCTEPVEELDKCNSQFYQRYRTIDGTCNNKKNPTQGAALTPLRRLSPAQYENGVNTPKGWVPGTLYNGFELPNPRQLSVDIIGSEEDVMDLETSLMLFLWGQFLDHDLDHTPLVSASAVLEDMKSCNDVCENLFPCFPVPPADNDPRITPDQCIPITRAAAICMTGEEPYVRQQVNALTSYIDASNVYGSSQEQSDALRDDDEIQFLKTSAPADVGGKPLLPFVKPDNHTECVQNPDGPFVPCFVAGDVRSNEHLVLTAIHTLFVREHNRIAAELTDINPKWSAEKVFQETRKIVGAIMQIITYRDWLPTILGEDFVESLGEYKYDKDVDASVTNEFATAAFRLHNTIRPTTFRLDDNLLEDYFGSIPLHHAFFAAFRIVQEGGIDPLIRGLYGVPGKKITPQHILTTELTERLFALARTVSLDLASINIQRGRDHGLPGYNQIRQVCGLGRADDFNDLSDDIPENILDQLEAAYGDVDNIDLWVGGLVESSLPGANVGPTFFCVLAEQFIALRSGDRFWYENKNVFKNKQLSELEKVSLAGIICDNTDNIERVPEDVFRSLASADDMVPCDQIPRMDLTEWK